MLNTAEWLWLLSRLGRGIYQSFENILQPQKKRGKTKTKREFRNTIINCYHKNYSRLESWTGKFYNTTYKFLRTDRRWINGKS